MRTTAVGRPRQPRFGSVLRIWRKKKSLSQLQLATQTGYSARHICFLETGRAKPSRQTAIQLASALEVTERELAGFLAAAGFEHHDQPVDFADPRMDDVRHSLEFVLRQHEPYPAAVVDVGWSVLLKNLSYRRFLRAIRDEHGEMPAQDMFFRARGLRCCNTNWEETVCFALQRVYSEVLRGRSQFTPLLAKLESYPGIPRDWRTRVVTSQSNPVLRLDIRLNQRDLKFFATFTTFWSSSGAGVQDLGIMSWFPRDDRTRRHCIKHFAG